MSISLSFRWLTKVLLISLIWWYVFVICPFFSLGIDSWPWSCRGLEARIDEIVEWVHAPHSSRPMIGVKGHLNVQKPKHATQAMTINDYLCISMTSPVECYLGNRQIHHVFMRPKRSWRKPTKLQPFGLGVSPVHWDVPKLRGIQRISRTIWDTWIPFGFWAFKAAAKHFRHFRCELQFENVELNFQTFWKSWILFSVVSFKVRLGGSPILYCA